MSTRKLIEKLNIIKTKPAKRYQTATATTTTYQSYNEQIQIKFLSQCRQKSKNLSRFLALNLVFFVPLASIFPPSVSFTLIFLIKKNTETFKKIIWLRF